MGDKPVFRKVFGACKKLNIRVNSYLGTDIFFGSEISKFRFNYSRKKIIYYKNLCNQSKSVHTVIRLLYQLKNNNKKCINLLLFEKIAIFQRNS
jgi:hypothetical protein